MASRSSLGLASGNIPPAVSVVVPVRNRCRLTLRFLGCLAMQTYPNLRVVVVDSCSSDNTVEAVSQLHPYVQIISAGNDDYWAGAVNRGVLYALQGDSEWIFTVNDDAMIGPGHIECLMSIALANECEILGSQINYLADPGLIWSIGTYTQWGTADFLRLGCHNLRNEERPFHVASAQVLEVDALPGNGVLIHRSVFGRVGIYGQRILPHYHADSEFIMRAVKGGIRAWVTPQLILLNDFKTEQKKLPIGNIRGFAWALGHPKSYLFMPALLYVFWCYCPLRKKVITALALFVRLFKILQ